MRKLTTLLVREGAAQQRVQTQGEAVPASRLRAATGRGFVGVACWWLAASSGAAAGFGMGCTPVPGDRIRVRDLAAVDATFSGLEQDLDIGPAPVATSVRVFHNWELANLARRYSLVRSDSAPEQVCFERVSQALTAQQLLPVFAAALAEGSLSEPARIEILDFSHKQLPLGTLDFQRRDLSEAGLWKGSLRYGDGRSVPLWAHVQVTSGVSGKPLVYGGDDISHAHPLPAALPVTSKSAPPKPRPIAKPDVERGKPVDVEVARGGVRLGFSGAAESSGHVGEAVVVRNPANGRRFRAVVTAEGKVAIRP